MAVPAEGAAKKETAVKKKAVVRCVVVYCRSNGRITRLETVKKGGFVTLPNMKNKRGYTFMGWSQKKGQQMSPDYEAGMRFRVTENKRFYAVEFDRRKEKNLKWRQILPADREQYSHVIFVGDSRTVGIRTAFWGDFQKYPADVTFVAKGGEGLSWFKDIGEETLLHEVGLYEQASRPVAVIFNLGVNDLDNLSQYIFHMNQLAETLSAKNCRLFYMSVNPLNSAMRRKTTKKEEFVRKFNLTLQKRLRGFTYIDTYRFLLDRGFSTIRNEGTPQSKDDGLHYTGKTYKRIYQYCMETLSRSSG